MEKKEVLLNIQQELSKSGYETYASILQNFLERQKEKQTRIIGVIGDDLVGKSTIINMILKDKLLPTTVIPSPANICVKYDNETLIYDETENIIKNANLYQLIEKENNIIVTTNNEYLKSNALEFKEFHGLFSRQNFNNLKLMSDIYKCNAVIMVISAEHLLSQLECSFIDNYIKYVGASHLLIIVNKLSLMEKSDLEPTLDYVKKQIELKFPEVNWTIYDNISNEGTVSKYIRNSIQDEISQLFVINQEQNDSSIKNILQYIKIQLQKEKNILKSRQEENTEIIKKNREIVEQQKKLEEALIEKALIDFQQKRNNTLELVDLYIKEQFETITSDLIVQYKNAANKYTWYERELEQAWMNAISIASVKTDEFITKEIVKDINWLNDTLKIKLGEKAVAINIVNANLCNTEKVNPYGTYKKYASIGIGGGVVIGFCLCNVVGAVIGLGSGLLAYSYFATKDASQDEEIKIEIASKIKDISSDTRKLSRKDIKRIYDEIILEFKKEATKILEAKYKLEENDIADYVSQINNISKVINMIEEI